MGDRGCLHELGLDGSVRAVPARSASPRALGGRPLVLPAASAVEGRLVGVIAPCTPSPPWPRSPLASGARAAVARRHRSPGGAALWWPRPSGTSGASRSPGSLRSPLRAGTTSCSSACQAPARRCWRRSCRACCRSLLDGEAPETTRTTRRPGSFCPDRASIRTPPFRAPHHGVAVGRAGWAAARRCSDRGDQRREPRGPVPRRGGGVPCPGVLDALRQPLEEGVVRG